MSSFILPGLEADTIKEMKVPYSEDHSVLEYYKGLIENGTIEANVESITEQIP